LTNPDAGPARTSGRRILAGLAGGAIAIGLLLWAFRGVHIGEVVRQIRGSDPWPLALGVVLATITFPMRLIRWRLLLRSPTGAALPAAPLWHAIAIGFMANNLLPFRAGELVRTFAATKLSGARFTTAMSSIAVERVFDGLAVVALLGLGLLASDLPAGVVVGGVSLARAAQVAGILSLAALSAAGAVVAFPAAAERLIRRLLPAGTMADRLVSIIEGLRQGLASLRSPVLVAKVSFWSLALWLVNALSFYVTFAAFDIPVGFAGALLVQGVLVIGISVQLTPGYVGQFEAAIVAALALYGISNQVASSYAVAYHGATFIPITLAGAWSLARTPVELSDLRGVTRS
jgi:uncharacterized protein (TIRG00374 family)